MTSTTTISTLARAEIGVLWSQGCTVMECLECDYKVKECDNKVKECDNKAKECEHKVEYSFTQHIKRLSIARLREKNKHVKRECRVKVIFTFLTGWNSFVQWKVGCVAKGIKLKEKKKTRILKTEESPPHGKQTEQCVSQWRREHRQKVRPPHITSSSPD